jgi:hypothetical protein
MTQSNKLVEFRSKTGSVIGVEVSDAVKIEGGIAASFPNRVAIQAAKSFEEAISQIGPIAQTVYEQLVHLTPTECSVEFGIKFSSELNVVVASGKGEGNFVVKLVWKQENV